MVNVRVPWCLCGILSRVVLHPQAAQRDRGELLAGSVPVCAGRFRQLAGSDFMRDFPYRGCGELHNLGDMSGYCKDVLQLQRWFTLLYSLRVLRTVLSVARVVLDNHELLAATAGRIKANRRNNHPVHERAQLTAGPAWDHRSTHRPASLLIVPEFALI